MINPMLAMLNQNQALRMIRNPQAMITQMPQYRQVVNYVNENGGDAKTLFYAKAQEMGVDPDAIIKAMRNA